MNKENYFKTSDLALISFISLHLPIESVDRTNPKRTEFVFESSEKLDALVDSFWRRETKVEPVQYFSQIKVIKTRIYSNE